MEKPYGLHASLSCVLIDFTAGEELVRKTEKMVPQLPQIVVSSTLTLGTRQLNIAEDFVSPDLPDPEIIRRVQCMENLNVRIREEVPDPKYTKIFLDGATEEDDAPLRKFSQILNAPHMLVFSNATIPVMYTFTSHPHQNSALRLSPSVIFHTPAAQHPKRFSPVISACCT